MNSIELAELLYARGYHSVLEERGVDVEKVLLGYSPNPINSKELVRVAKLEGFVLTNNGWIEKVLLKAIKEGSVYK